mmetsp:Transcript_40365/g.49174  ORF Transcript_40365/g.49174 Transcript_40365/m.49174 type:complete len:234 (+) Transcript_40365:101-802(+)|eukprot:CAMPEP_0172498248 /NCGR_PEP_ID=MMETSP1066-20121228/111235_1 /TAXON_ID=671091 /ORGANISM="Coscinodiscus wailesii, Strain CCMP2513" /LENGTH=233 /DNA_ID=CAMNT_0013271461 /DNA_START=91 /DNA_END=792 /DNA_ORIENTATION=-
MTFLKSYILREFFALSALLLISSRCNAFHTSTLSSKPPFLIPSLTNSKNTQPQQRVSQATTLRMAGFGGGSGSSKKSKKKGKTTGLKPLKPKAQWDRYRAFKTSVEVKVGVKKVGGDDGDGEEEWLNVGYVKSEGDEFRDVAVARQRALIAEHAKRVHPLKVSQKDALEWGYYDDEAESYIVVSKDVCNDAPDGIERKIGFEGIADPTSGFYCHYYEGRIVETSDEKNFLKKQ